MSTWAMVRPVLGPGPVEADPIPDLGSFMMPHCKPPAGSFPDESEFSNGQITPLRAKSESVVALFLTPPLRMAGLPAGRVA
jgi:hypothetical protein